MTNSNNLQIEILENKVHTFWALMFCNSTKFVSKAKPQNSILFLLFSIFLQKNQKRKRAKKKRKRGRQLGQPDGPAQQPRPRARRAASQRPAPSLFPSLSASGSHPRRPRYCIARRKLGAARRTPGPPLATCSRDPYKSPKPPQTLALLLRSSQPPPLLPPPSPRRFSELPEHHQQQPRP